MLGEGTYTWHFTYNADGLRTKRTEDSISYTYVYNGSSLSKMTVGSNTLYFGYDASGAPMTVTYNNTTYFYVTNLQGDIVAILDSNGAVVIKYTYDAWGKLLTTTGSMATTLGKDNPLRYRGYVYDTETGLYYLQSRYYDPEIGRFINADSLVSTGQGILGNNMFAYCLNNPVIHADYSGTDAIVLFDEDTLGHIGVMVQDDEGTWWHYYWGTKGGKEGITARLMCLFTISVEPYSWCVSFNGDASSLSEINGSNQYSGDYEIMHYFSGDFTEAISHMQNYSEKYNLYTNNCSQVSLRILAAANEEYYALFSGAAQYRLPIRANEYITNNKSNYASTDLRYYNATIQRNHCLW